MPDLQANGQTRVIKIGKPVSGEETVSSQELIGDGGKLLIQHLDQYYQLRITRSGKLILTK